MSELDALMKAFEEAGGDKAILENNKIAHLVASGHKLLSMKSVEGLEVDAKETLTGISAKVIVTGGTKIKNPVHLCFGVLHKKGTQKIRMDVKLKKGSSAHFIAHCIFPKAEKVRHIMDAVVEIGEGAEMRYSETHYHGLYGGIEVVPKAFVRIAENGRYFADFTLTTGRVGTLDIDYSVTAGVNAVTELTARVFGHENDYINIKEKVVLAGKNSRSIIKTGLRLKTMHRLKSPALPKEMQKVQGAMWTAWK